MNPSQIPLRLYEASEFARMEDPGDAGTITIDRMFAYVPIVTAAAETRTVSDPDKPGIIATLYMVTDGGDCTFTFETAYTESGQTSLVFANVGESITLISVKSSTSVVWRVLSRQGAATITDPSGGATSDAEARTAINAIIDRLQDAGILQ